MRNTKIIIIGGGISGLYSAYKILSVDNAVHITILEKQSKRFMGGRTGMDIFCGERVVIGAGIGRLKKDYLLKLLIAELGVPVTKDVLNPTYSSTVEPVNINKILRYLKKIYISSPETYKTSTLKQFATKILGSPLYERFVISNGYSDYENADIMDFLSDYGVDDNTCCLQYLNIPWDKLVLALVNKIGNTNIVFGSNVVNIQCGSTEFSTITDTGKIYNSDKVIIATTIKGIRDLVPNARLPTSIYSQIHPQPFLRLYGKFSKSSSENIRNYVSDYTIVPKPLQKILSVNQKNGIYMIAYCDNESAVYLNNYVENTAKNREFLCFLIENSLNMPAGTLTLLKIKDYFWKSGTHYYSPLIGKFKNRKQFCYQAQHPMPNMLVVGEAVSRDQGWTEGALDSVNLVVTEKWIKQKRHQAL